MKNIKQRLIRPLALGVISAVVFVALATIIADLYAPLKNWLAETFSHHWIGKGILSLAIFAGVSVLSTLILGEEKPDEEATVVWVLFWTMLVATFAVMGFYVYEWMIH